MSEWPFSQEGVPAIVAHCGSRALLPRVPTGLPTDVAVPAETAVASAAAGHNE